MFQTGEKIIYGQTGVCEVAGLCEKALDKNGVKQYYTLKPIFQVNNVIYAPVDNDKIFMRHIMSVEEANKLIAKIPELREKAVSEYHNVDYQNTEWKIHDSEELIVLAFMMDHRRKEARRLKKKLNFTDEKNLRLIKNLLFGELAAIFDVSIEDACEKWFFKTTGL